MSASILHADLDAFFASVEQRDAAALRGRPIAVGGGVVMAASYEARAFGVRSAMGGRQARELCPDIVFVPPRWPAYVEASKAVFAIFEETAPVVEKLSIDEAFLDVAGLEHISGTPREIAARLRAAVLDEVGLPLTVGVARTKSLAKVASAQAKPYGLLVVEPDEERAFLHPLGVEALWGVGPVTTRKLRECGIVTVGQLAGMPRTALIGLLGRAAGRHLHALAHGEDRRRVESGRRRRSFGAQSATGSRTRTVDEADTVLSGLVDRVTRRMRRAQRVGRTVTLRLRFADFTRATRSRTLLRPTASSEAVLAAARSLLAVARPTIERRGLTMIGVAVSGIARAEGEQLELPLGRPPRTALDGALDDVRERYGPTAVTRATHLGRDPGLAAWLMPGE